MAVGKVKGRDTDKPLLSFHSSCLFPDGGGGGGGGARSRAMLPWCLAPRHSGRGSLKSRPRSDGNVAARVRRMMPPVTGIRAPGGGQIWKSPSPLSGHEPEREAEVRRPRANRWHLRERRRCSS